MPRIRRRCYFIVLTVLILGGIAIMLLALHRPDRRPNVILISIDSLRPDHLGCYGYARNTSPALDRLAAEGTRFRTAVSSTSWTLPAHAALLTGLPDRVHGCFDYAFWLDGSRETLAEAFQEAGYRTAGFYSGPNLHPVFGFSQGFDAYRDCTSYADQMIAVLNGKEELQVVLDRSDEDITNPIVLKNVVQWLDARSGDPFFMFIHMWDVHLDYRPPPPYDTQFDPYYEGTVNGRAVGRDQARAWSRRDLQHFEALYDGEIRWTDETLRQLFDALRARGIQDNTVVVVTSDHGDAFLEHGRIAHMTSLYEEEIRIPLLIRHPVSVPAGGVVDRPVHIIDVAPTVLGLAGLPPLPHALGRDLSPLIRDPGHAVAGSALSLGASHPDVGAAPDGAPHGHVEDDQGEGRHGPGVRSGEGSRRADSARGSSLSGGARDPETPVSRDPEGGGRNPSPAAGPGQTRYPFHSGDHEGAPQEPGVSEVGRLPDSENPSRFMKGRES